MITVYLSINILFKEINAKVSEDFVNTLKG